MGDWLKTYGETMYDTRKSFMQPADWGVAVENGNKIYLHITNPKAINNTIEIKDFPYALISANWFETGNTIEFKTNKINTGVTLQIPALNPDAIDQVIVLEVKK